MSNLLKDRAVILRKYDFGESSLIFVALTRSSGKVSFLAKGAKKSTSPFFGRLRTGNIAEVVFYDKAGRNLQLLKELEDQVSFDSGGHDLERLCLFQAGLEIIDKSTGERESNSGIFDLWEWFITVLRGAVDPWIIFFALQVKVLEKTGFLPSISECGGCRKSLAGLKFSIDPASGLVTCGECAGERGKVLTSAACRILERMIGGDVKGITTEILSPPQRSELGRVLHKLFIHHVEGYSLPRSLRLLKGVN
ncbi:MAG: DNA repair protein RecO [Candidatus Krumholzibacteriota bacterium]|nr:DNA repair protein RecO [Candidatus Krumholzibacteriota bacterium]